jgi:hypothetical protein
MNNTEFLSEILSLCETHMSEGNYLRASNMLKDVHHDIPIRNENEFEELFFERPLRVWIFADDDDETDETNETDETDTNFTIFGIFVKKIVQNNGRTIKVPLHFNCKNDTDAFTIKCTNSDISTIYVIPLIAIEYFGTNLKKHILDFLRKNLAESVTIYM